MPEWGTDGRIIYITQKCEPKKKRRAKELVRLVDQQLGRAEQPLPKGTLVNIIPYI